MLALAIREQLVLQARLCCPFVEGGALTLAEITLDKIRMDSHLLCHEPLQCVLLRGCKAVFKSGGNPIVELARCNPCLRWSNELLAPEQ